MKTLQQIASNLEHNLGVSDPTAAQQAVADFRAFDREIPTDYLKALMDRAEWIERRLECIALEADAGDCPKDDRWFERGGRCGWAHECGACTMNPGKEG